MAYWVRMEGCFKIIVIGRQIPHLSGYVNQVKDFNPNSKHNGKSLLRFLSKRFNVIRFAFSEITLCCSVDKVLEGTRWSLRRPVSGLLQNPSQQKAAWTGSSQCLLTTLLTHKNWHLKYFILSLNSCKYKFSVYVVNDDILEYKFNFINYFDGIQWNVNTQAIWYPLSST